MIAGVGVFLLGYGFALLVGAGCRAMIARAEARKTPTEQQTLDEYEDIMVRRNLAQYQSDLYQLHMVSRHEAAWRARTTLAGQGLADALDSGNEAQRKAALAYWAEVAGSPALLEPEPTQEAPDGD